MLEQLEAGVRSAPEYDVRALVLACPGLAEPLWNPLLRLPTGRLVSPDGFWIDSATASEVDGRDQHSADIAGPDAFDQTYAKRVWMEAAGIDVVSFTGRQPRTASQLVISRIVDAVTRNAGRGLPPGVEIVRPAPPPW
ncbi:MAG: hypothetical protein JO246_15050 [Frankiaceae bacterium]|nr:hypothetical protein [Frankiaceae bacterium]MBV9869771.1 hypothetical protein [Frankiaceae bacterium]